MALRQDHFPERKILIFLYNSDMKVHNLLVTGPTFFEFFNESFGRDPVGWNKT